MKLMLTQMMKCTLLPASWHQWVTKNQMQFDWFDCLLLLNSCNLKREQSMLPLLFSDYKTKSSNLWHKQTDCSIPVSFLVIDRCNEMGKCNIGVLWKYCVVHQLWIIWKPLETSVNLWKPLKTSENLWKPHETGCSDFRQVSRFFH